MKIGILGAGNIGGTVGRLWAKAGHQVRFGTRHPEEQGALVHECGARASGGHPADAVAFGEAILLAVPLKAVPELARTHGAQLAGKVILDATNPYEDRDGELARTAVAHPSGSTGWVASQLPGARVVKGFNTVYFKTLQSEAHRPGERVGIPLASDDLQAMEIASTLVRDAGFDPVPVGGLSRGKDLQPGTKVYATGASGPEVRRVLGLAQR